MRQQSVASAIPLLLDTGCPTAVPRFVALGIVDAIQRALIRWSTPHVREKINVRIPTRAHHDASVKVAEMILRRGLAALQHRAPRQILYAACIPVCFVMDTAFGMHSTHEFALLTPAAFHITAA